MAVPHYDRNISFISDGIPHNVDSLIISDLQLLVVAMHLAESRKLNIDRLNDIATLLNRFVDTFPQLYDSRHHTQVVHSIQHIAQTVANYGPLQNYSTFSFESVLGKLFNLLLKSCQEHYVDLRVDYLIRARYSSS